eukprot:scpid9918/ scgid20838/ Protein sidekick-2
MAVFARYAAGLTLLGCILLGLPQDGACIEKNHGDSIVSSAQATTTTITINFSKNVDGYAVQWDTSGSSNTALITGTTLTLKNLAEGTKYSINFLKPEIPFTRYYMYTTPTTNLSIASVTHQTITVSFQLTLRSKIAYYYCVNYTLRAVSSIHVNQSIKQICQRVSTFVIHGLEEDAEYELLGFGQNDDRQNGPLFSPVSVTTDPGPPSRAPSSLVVTPPKGQSYSLTWKPIDFRHVNGRFTHYSIIYKLGDKSMSANVTVPVFNFTTLADDVPYNISVAVVSAGGVGPYANIEPNRPTLVMTNDSGPTWISLNISASLGFYRIVKYCAHLSRTSVSGVSQGVGSTTICSNTSFITFRNLEEAAKFNVTASVTSSISRITALPSLSIGTKPTAPTGHPLNMTVTMKSQDGFVLVWAPVPYLLLNGFLRFYNVSVQATGTVTRYSTTRNNTIRFDTLDFGRDYTVKVRATNEVGSGPAAMITVRVPQDVPVIDSLTTVENSTSLQVSALRLPGILFHAKEYCASYRRLSTSGHRSTDHSVSQHCYTEESFLITNLQENSTYNVSVFVRNTVDKDSNIKSVLAITLESSPTASPTNITVKAASVSSLTLSWSALPVLELNGILQWYVVNYTQEGSGIPMTAIATQENVTVDGLEFGTAYTFKIAALCTGGQGPFSNVFKAFTGQDVPPKPIATVEHSKTSVNVRISIPLSEELQKFSIGKYCAVYELVAVSAVAVLRNATHCANSTFITITGLEHDSNYSIYCYVETTSSGRSNNSRTHSVKTDAAAPSAAPVLNVVNVTTTSFSLFWTELDVFHRNGPITGYRVNSSDGRLLNTTRLYIQLTAYQPNTVHQVSVAAIGYGGLTGPAATIQVKTLDAVPDRPAVVVTSTANDISVSIVPTITTNWTVNQYCISLDGIPTTGLNWTLALNTKTICSATAAPQTYPGLEEFTTYQISVWVTNIEARAGANTTVVITTQTARPSSAPQSLSGTSTVHEIALTWSPPPPIDQNGIITQYVINVSATSPIAKTLPKQVVFGTVTSTTLNNLQAYTDYNISISAKTSAGVGPASTSILVTTAESMPSTGPSIESVIALSSSTIHVNWSTLAQQELNGVLQGYRVQWTNAAGQSEKQELKANVTSVVLTNLTAHTLYNISVSAKTTPGHGPYGAASAIQTQENVPLTGPSIQTTMALSSSSIYVNWSVVAQQELNGVLQGYQVLYIDTAGQNKSVEVNATVTSAVLTNLTAYTVYDVSVKARTGPGYGPLGATASQRSEEDVPAQVTGVDVKLQSSTDSITANVSWSPLTNIHGTITAYIVCYQPVNAADRHVKLPVSAKASTTVLRNLTDKQDYEFTVHGVTSAGGGNNSTTITQTGLPKRPGTISNISVNFLNSSSVQMAWTISPVSQPDQYRLFAYSHTDSSTTGLESGRTASTSAAAVLVMNKTVIGSITDTTLSGLNASTHYAFDVIAVNAYSSTLFSSASTVNFKNLSTSAAFYKTPEGRPADGKTSGTGNLTNIAVAAGAAMAVLLVGVIALFVLRRRRMGSSVLVTPYKGVMESRFSITSTMTLEMNTADADAAAQKSQSNLNPVVESKAVSRGRSVSIPVDSADSRAVVSTTVGSTVILPVPERLSNIGCYAGTGTDDVNTERTWRRAGVLIEDLQASGRFTVLANGDLQISRALAEDSGIYSCTMTLVDESNYESDSETDIVILTVAPRGFAGLTVAGLQPDDDSTIYDRVALGTTPCPTQHNASTLLKDDGDADSGQEYDLYQTIGILSTNLAAQAHSAEDAAADAALWDVEPNYCKAPSAALAFVDVDEGAGGLYTRCPAVKKPFNRAA